MGRGDRVARRDRTADPDFNDGARHRARLAAARARQRRGGPRNRRPDGGGDFGRTGDFDPVEPARAADAGAALWEICNLTRGRPR